MRLWKTHECLSKQLPNSPIKSFNMELISIMVNEGQIHRETRNFVGLLPILIKLDDKLT